MQAGFTFRRADLTASALLQGIRGEGPQLYTLRLASAAISTREQSILIIRLFIKSADWRTNLP